VRDKHISVLEIDMDDADSYKHRMDSALLRKHVGALIRARRKNVGMTQVALAARMGMSRAALANVETGRQNIVLPQLYRFAATLDLPVTELLPDPAAITGKPRTQELPLPANLSRSQRAQIARLLSDDGTAPTHGGEQHAAKKSNT
jgi:transcriptional regulator with XRE-family HTH domain